MAITEYDVGTGGNSASSATLQITCAHAVAIGDLLVLGCIGNSSATAFSSVTDSGGNTWQQGTPTTAGTGAERSSFFYTVATHALSTSDTITLSSGAGRFAALTVMGFTGASFPATSTVLDQQVAAGDASSGTPMSSGATGTLAQAVEVAVGIFGSSAGAGTTFLATGAWTAAAQGMVNSTTTVRSTGSEWQVTASTAALTATGTLSASSDWQAICATFLSAPPPPQTFTPQPHLPLMAPQGM